MPLRRDATRGPAVLVFLLLVLAFTLSGCELTIESPRKAPNDAQRAALSTGIAQLPDYDVAVSAIDFDPPLNRETVLNSQRPIKLLAAVENKGTMPATGLTVEARITSQKGEFTAQDRAQIERLSPGETRLVEFVGVAPVPVNTLPRSPSYQIRVTVSGKQLDGNTSNNTREVIVRVTD